MKLNNEKGVTVVVLVITVIILAILASVTVYTGGNIIKKANLQTINTNMMLIQAKGKTIQEQAKFNNNTSNYKGTMVKNISGNKNIDALVNSGVITDTSNYYLLSLSDLADMGLNKVDIELGYIINYNTEEVIYVKGFENDGTRYYKLSEMKDLVIK